MSSSTDASKERSAKRAARPAVRLSAATHVSPRREACEIGARVQTRRQTQVMKVEEHHEYKMKGVEEVKYMRGDENRVNARNQENLEKSNVECRGKQQKEAAATNIKSNIHTSESQQEFFRMLDEKIEKVRPVCVRVLNNRVGC
uniref:Uncharacterized protein n=1 Tax=Fundulus heteroclitus TaxID=8078 RepID=A0A3Q2NPW8_FUNHE